MKSFEPLPWSDYFDDLRVLETERGSFGVYVAGWPAEGQEPRPVIFAVHGGRIHRADVVSAGQAAQG